MRNCLSVWMEHNAFIYTYVAATEKLPARTLPYKTVCSIQATKQLRS
jgi:hypothetical protein